MALDLLASFGKGDFPYALELQCLGIAIQGAMMVRNGPNRDGTLHWFHAFSLSVLGGFGGGIIGFMWMGLPSGFFINDLNMAACIIAFCLVNYTPGDIGYKIFRLLPCQMAYVVFAQLFRSNGVVGFVNTCYNLNKEKHNSAYYPIPVFGPIMYGTLLGNWGAFVLKGFNGHVANGMPWAIQNGLFCASFYHFYTHDMTGMIGRFLRTSLPLKVYLGADDDETAARMFVTVFMQIMGQLQLPFFLGPSFSPFGTRLLSPFLNSATWYTGPKETAYSQAQAQKKLKKKNKRKKTNGSTASKKQN